MTEKDKTAWHNVETSMGFLANKQLHKLVRLARRELSGRHRAAVALKEWETEGFRGLANFMAGVTWALSCRAALRESAGHPPIGKRAQSGEMWLPREMLKCVRHQVKDRGWHPLSAESAHGVLNELAAEQRPRPQSDNFEAVKFVIPFVKQEARVEVSAPKQRFSYAQRMDFDYGGES